MLPKITPGLQSAGSFSTTEYESVGKAQVLIKKEVKNEAEGTRTLNLRIDSPML